MSTRTTKTANRLLWTAQILAAAMFLFAGSVKFTMSPEQLQGGPVSLPVSFILFIGACEVLGALGLLLPGLLRIHTSLTSLAATGLTIIMVGATTITVVWASVPAAIMPAVIGIVTASIVYGRTRVAPLSDAPRRALRVA